jgi:hypothetical protein
VHVVSAAQPLAQLAREGAESVFAHVNCVHLVSKQQPSETSVANDMTHIGTQHIPEQVSDFPSGKPKSIRSHG